MSSAVKSICSRSGLPGAGSNQHGGGGGGLMVDGHGAAGGSSHNGKGYGGGGYSGYLGQPGVVLISLG